MIEQLTLDRSALPTTPPPASRLDPKPPSRRAGTVPHDAWYAWLRMRDEGLADGTHSTTRKYFCEGCRDWVDGIYWGIDRHDYCFACYARMFPGNLIREEIAAAEARGEAIIDARLEDGTIHCRIVREGETLLSLVSKPRRPL